MSETDTNVTLELELKDGAKVYSCINGGGVPYIFVNNPDGSESGSMHIANGYTKAEVIAWCVCKYQSHSTNEEVRKCSDDMEIALHNIFAERKRTHFVYGDELKPTYTDQNYPEYQDIKDLFDPDREDLGL